VTVSADQVIRVWSFITHEMVYEKFADHCKFFFSIFFYKTDENELLTNAAGCKDDIHFTTADSGGYFKIWSVEFSAEFPKKNSLTEVAFIRGHKKEITSTTFFEDEGEFFLATGSLDKNLQLYTLEGKN